MFDNREVLAEINSRFHQEIDEYSDKDKIIVEANAHIDAMIKFECIDIVQLQNHYSNWIAESSELSYFKGLQDGARFLNKLVLGDCVKEAMMTWGTYLENPYKVKSSIDSRYKGNQNTFKAGGES